MLHGGQFRHYLTAKGRVTHIIASNLPLRKRLEFRSYKVVKPEWITESIRQMKLLPWQNFATLHEAGARDDQPQLQLYRSVSAATTTTAPNCNDPDFIRNYLASSRLHHLSNWKANLRREFLKYYPPPPKDNSTASNYILFHVDFDCFFATVSYHHTKNLNPGIDIDIDRDPIVVCHGTNNSDIASSNYVARRYGIKNGMWVSHAKTLLPHGVALRVLPYCFEEFELVSRKFYEVLRGMSVFKYVVPVSIDEAICVVLVGSRDDTTSGSDMDPEFCKDVCREVRERVFESTDGCNVSIGCAPSLVLARLALRLGKPNGYYVITDADTAGSAFWSKFQLGDLPGIGGSSAQKLRNEFGADSLQNLEGLRRVATPERLKKCLGPKLGERVSLALCGKDDLESIKLIREPHSLFERKTLSLDINWAIRFSNIQEVDLFLERCTGYLVEKLTEDLHKYVSQVGLKIMKRAEGAPIEPPKYLGMGKCDALSTSSRLGIATNEFGVIATEVKYLFRTLNCPPVQVRGVAVQFNKLVDPPSRKNKKNSSASSSPKRLGALDEFFSPFKHNGTSPRGKGLRDAEGSLTSGGTNGKVGISDYSMGVPKLLYVSPNKNDKPDEMNSIRAKYKKLNISPVKRLDQLRGEAYQESFLRELPTQIRRNLQQDLRILKKVNESKAAKIKERVEQQKEAERKTYSHFHGSDSIFRPVEFQQMKSFKRICDTIIGWVRETIEDEGPHESDVRIFQNYLIRLSESNKLHLVLRISKLISQTLALESGRSGKLSGFQEWDQILLGTVVPILNRNRHSYQTGRSLDIEFEL